MKKGMSRVQEYFTGAVCLERIETTSGTEGGYYILFPGQPPHIRAPLREAQRAGEGLSCTHR